MVNKLLFLSMLIIPMLFFGCVGTPAEGANVSLNISASTTATPTPTATALPKEEFKPMKLVYILPSQSPSGERQITVTMWLEKKKTCGEREAFVGLQKMEENQQTNGWSKVTVYEDNGEMVVSGWNQQSDLAFDTLKSRESDFDISLTLNDIFAAAGENFLNSSVWNSTEPMILHNVEHSNTIANYSIFKTGMNLSGKPLPCSEFKIAEKGPNVDGTYTACVAEVSKDVPLPFIVSLEFENAQGPRWNITSFSYESSGMVFVPQCLEPVRCKYIPRTPQSEQSDCDAKNGTIEQIRDERNCITTYECWTAREKAINNIKNMQNPQCSEPSDAIINQAVDCASKGISNFNVTHDNQGCISGINACTP